MSELDIKRLNNLTDELEKRVKNLEISKVDKDEIVTIEEVAENLIFNPLNKEKRFKFISNTNTYIVAKLEVESPATFSAKCQIYANDVLVREQDVTFPFSLEVPIKPTVGENRLKVVMYNESVTSDYKLNMKLSITGKVVKKDTKYKLATLMGDSIYLKAEDTIKSYNVNTMETVSCFTGKDAVASCFLNNSILIFLIKKGNEIMIERRETLSNKTYKSYDVSSYLEDFNECAIEHNNGRNYIFFIKGDNAFMFTYESDSVNFMQNLKLKAKKINVFSGSTGRYVYYADNRGNYTVVKHYSYSDFREEKSISIGKLENANLSEENGRLMVLYKQGLVIFKKPVFEQGDPVVVGVGDEGTITAQGDTIIRRGNKLIKL